MVSFIASSGRGDNILKADVLKKNQFPRRAKVIMWGSEMIKFISALVFLRLTESIKFFSIVF